MSKFDALYTKIIGEQFVAPPPHAITILNHINLVSKIVKRQDINKRPEAINQIMHGVMDPANMPPELKAIGSDLTAAVSTIGKYIAAQPVDHRSDIIEYVRQNITHPAHNGY